MVRVHGHVRAFQLAVLTAFLVGAWSRRDRVDVASVVEKSYEYLEAHECVGRRWGLPYHYYRPALEKYPPYQWLWDSASHMIVWSHRNVTNSVLDMRTLLQMQQPDGRIPEIVFWGSDKISWWRRLLHTGWYSNPRAADITQMPLLPFALRAIHNACDDLKLLQEFLPKLVAYQYWWNATRTATGSHLISILHPWESGLDASPTYDAAYSLHKVTVGYWDIYPRFLKLLLSYKFIYGWNTSKILGRSKSLKIPWDNWFIVMDVGVNSVYAAGWRVLAELASALDGELARECREMNAKVEADIHRYLWNATVNRFESLYRDGDGVIQQTSVETIQTLFPLLLTSTSPQRVHHMVQNQLVQPKKFWAKYPLPSCSLDSPQFKPSVSMLMWRGPTWPILNWLIMEGLILHGYTKEACNILDSWILLYQQSGIWEQYDPLTGQGMGPEGLGMSTLVVDWIFRLNKTNECFIDAK